MDDKRVDREGRAPAPAAPGTQSCKGCATGRCLPQGHLKGGWEAGLIVFLATAGVLAVVRPDLYAGLVHHAGAISAGLSG
ncbi:hypothetical protein ACFWBF_09875 [Streptomyces sp. NPDC060028]|uniref:hypothetical protein n=1 Tax=Streptomyces sp. NPDC060028 TaxID=3347041 RepID=UPI0036AF3061